LPQPLYLGGSRLVVHIQTSPEAIDDFINLISKIAEEKKKAGFVATPFAAPSTLGAGNMYKDVHIRIR
jgi:threonine aldolase